MVVTGGSRIRGALPGAVHPSRLANMTVEVQTPPPSAPKWERMPGAVLMKLEAAILKHRRAHGSGRYDLLRDDPLFSPWIGSHLGHRGEKRLDRAISALEQGPAQRAKRTIHPRPIVFAELAEPLKAAPGAEPLVEEFAEPLLAGGTAPLSHEELQAWVRKSEARLVRAIDDCFDQNGTLVNRDFYKLHAEYRATLRDGAALARSFNEDMHSAGVIGQVLARVSQECGGDPKKLRALSDDLSNIHRDATGLAAARAKPR